MSEQLSFSTPTALFFQHAFLLQYLAYIIYCGNSFLNGTSGNNNKKIKRKIHVEFYSVNLAKVHKSINIQDALKWAQHFFKIFNKKETVTAIEIMFSRN